MMMNADCPQGAQQGDLLAAAHNPSRRIVISGIAPAVDEGRYPAKRCQGDVLAVEADIFADGHEKLAGRISVNGPGRSTRLHPMTGVGNDRWQAELKLDKAGLWEFTVQAWPDQFGGFVRDTAKKRAAGLDLSLEAEEGRPLIEAAATGAHGTIKNALSAILDSWHALSIDDRISLLMAPETVETMAAAGTHPHLAQSRPYWIEVERKRAGFASW